MQLHQFKTPLIKKKTSRLKIVTICDGRKLIRTLHTLSDMDKGVTSKKMQLEAGLTHLSNNTVRGVLNMNGLSKEDFKRRKEFAHNMILYPDSIEGRYLLLFG